MRYEMLREQCSAFRKPMQLSSRDAASDCPAAEAFGVVTHGVQAPRKDDIACSLTGRSLLRASAMDLSRAVMLSEH